MDARQYYDQLDGPQKASFLSKLGVTKRYFEYNLTGGNSRYQRHPSPTLVRKIHKAARGVLTYTEILSTWWPELASEAKLRGGTPAKVATNDRDTGRPETSRANQRRPKTTKGARPVDTDQSAYGG